MKPLGVSLTIANGLPRYAVTHPSRAEDKVYEAVQEAIAAGWEVRRFVMEAREAWEHEQREQAKHDRADFDRALR